MTQDEQNDIDISRMLQKRIKALRALDEFKEWHMQLHKTGNQLIFIGLARDIIRGTEDEIDHITLKLVEKNMQALQKKMAG